MRRLTGLKVVAPWATEMKLGNISVSGGVRPALLFATPRLNRRAAHNAEWAARCYNGVCRKKYPDSSIEIDHGLFYQPFSWIVFSGDMVIDLVRDIVKLAEIEASGTVPFWIKPLIAAEFAVLHVYNPEIPLLWNAPVDGAWLMLEPYTNLAWYIANGVYPG